MTRPIFTPTDVQEIREAMNQSDVVHANFADGVIRVKHEVLGVPVGTLLVIRRTTIVNDGQTALVSLNGDHTLRRAPVTEGTVIAVVIGVLVEVPDGA